MYDNLHGFVAGMSPLTTPATVTQIFLQKKKSWIHITKLIINPLYEYTIIWNLWIKPTIYLFRSVKSIIGFSFVYFQIQIERQENMLEQIALMATETQSN